MDRMDDTAEEKEILVTMDGDITVRVVFQYTQLEPGEKSIYHVKYISFAMSLAPAASFQHNWRR